MTALGDLRELRAAALHLVRNPASPTEPEQAAVLALVLVADELHLLREAFVAAS